MSPRLIASTIAAGLLFTGPAAGHEETGQADYTLFARGLLNDHVCNPGEYKFIAANGDRVRCVDADGGFPRLAGHE